MTPTGIEPATFRVFLEYRQKKRCHIPHDGNLKGLTDDLKKLRRRILPKTSQAPANCKSASLLCQQVNIYLDRAGGSGGEE